MTRVVPPTRRQEHAFLSSVLYASIFDYPLTADQLHESLIGIEADRSLIGRWYAGSASLRHAIEFRDGFFFPRGRGELIDLRRQREAISRTMLAERRWALRLLLRFPYVRMVALSGSLAHLNASREADLDLFVITKPGRVWSVTLTLLALARVFGWRKHLCLNYVISERALAVEPRDLFSANQIVHLRPLCGAEQYARFLTANRFVADYYPNFRPRPVKAVEGGRLRHAVEWLLDRTIASAYERVCRSVYRSHLQRRAHLWQSRDQVRLERECLKLHTSSHRQAVMERFKRTVAPFGFAQGRDAERVRREAEVPGRRAP